ncbi:MAG: SUMF1/EgtB/PvdO family nonheme iron enzyme [Planctomycetota bacterium]
MAHRALIAALAVIVAAPGVPARPRPRAQGDNGHAFVKVARGAHRLGRPSREVVLGAFDIADAETTNEQFARFVAATGFVTDAERRGFGLCSDEGMLDWRWERVSGASWRRPRGPGGEPAPPDHPVTQVSVGDAEAYCEWLGARLPGLDEWEAAARAGRAEALYPWGDEPSPARSALANVWQGESHRANDRTDGFVFTSPVRSFPPNAWGLHDVIGNVFEYCASPPDAAVGRGGSWWCSESTCGFYNLVDVGRMSRRASLSNQGFRVAR